MMKLDVFSPTSPELKYFNLEILILDADKKALLSMFITHTRDLICSETKDIMLDNKEVNIYYKVLGLKNDKELRFIQEEHLFNGSLHASAFTVTRASMKSFIGGDNHLLMFPPRNFAASI